MEKKMEMLRDFNRNMELFRYYQVIPWGENDTPFV